MPLTKEQIIERTNKLINSLVNFLVKIYGSVDSPMWFIIVLCAFAVNIIIMFIPLRLFSEYGDFSLTESLIGLVCLPMLFLLDFLSDNPIYRPTSLTGLDTILKLVLFIFAILYILIFLFFILLIPKAEKRRKVLFSKELQNLLLQEGHIFISNFAEELNTSDEVIYEWLRRISPDYGIKRVERHIKVEDRRLYDEKELEYLMDQFILTKREINSERKE